MSYAIIRNTKYKRENLKGIYRHNERKNKIENLRLQGLITEEEYQNAISKI